jgi:hypothetical protein
MSNFQAIGGVSATLQRLLRDRMELPFGERPVPGDSGDRKWYDSPLPAETPLPRLVEGAHSRWPIEQFDEDATGACGLDHDQGRRWEGRHRHLALVRLASSFLAGQRWMPANPAGFSPLTPPSVLPGDPSPGASVTLPGCGAMAHRDQPDSLLPPQADLTKWY